MSWWGKLVGGAFGFMLGGPLGALLYSLVETAKANGLEPYEYLRHVLEHVAAADTVEKIEALLPWNTGLSKAQ